jgi:hypothetical protein
MICRVIHRSKIGVQIRRHFLLVTGLWLSLEAFSSRAIAVEFKGTVIWTAHGQKQSWLLFVKGPKCRLERNLLGEKAVVITDLGTKRLVVLYPDRRQYFVLQSDSPIAVSMDPFLLIDYFGRPGGLSHRKTGPETVAGYYCDRYVFYGKYGGDWLAYDLAQELDFPIRISVLLNIPGINPGWDSIQVTGLQIVSVGDALFQIPEGYTILKQPFSTAPTR